jgi:hypothetical protein
MLKLMEAVLLNQYQKCVLVGDGFAFAMAFENVP